MARISSAYEAARREQAAHGIPEYSYQAWRAHRNAAARRGIRFGFTVLRWHLWWDAALLALGPDARRGRRRGEYVMARYGDAGAYEVGNVYAATHKENAADIPADVRAVAVERTTVARIASGKPRGSHLGIRGDGHPRSRAVVTPLGRFGSIALAAEAHGITRQGGAAKVRRGVWAHAG